MKINRLKQLGYGIAPKHDHAQALRIRRSFIAFCGYLLLAAVVITAFCSGFGSRISNQGVFYLFLALLVSNMVIFLMLFTGINKRFKDPSLTLFQMLIGIIFCTLVAYYSEDSARGLTILLYLMVLMFGGFRLRISDFMMLSAIATLMYVCAMALLHIQDPQQASFSVEVLRTVSLLLALLWVSYMSNYIANLRRKIKWIASRDWLTGVYNRRELLRVLQREEALSKRSGIPFVVCIFDIDDFKEINDTYGHLAGDMILQKFAREIGDNIRSEDYVGRYGGEEFVVIFVNHVSCNIREASACRLMSVIRNLKFSDIAEDLKITASAGLAMYKPGDTIDSLLARADRALYRAKDLGKDRIEYEEEE